MNLEYGYQNYTAFARAFKGFLTEISELGVKYFCDVFWGCCRVFLSINADKIDELVDSEADHDLVDDQGEYYELKMSLKLK